MESNRKNVLILLGGLWHDFDGFASSMQVLLAPHGFQVEATYDLDCLLHLEENRLRFSDQLHLLLSTSRGL